MLFVSVSHLYAAALLDLILLMLRSFLNRPTFFLLGAFDIKSGNLILPWRLLDLDYLILRCLMSPTSGCGF